MRQNTELSAHEETEDESSSSTIIDNGEGSQAVDLERQKQIKQLKERENERRRIDSENLATFEAIAREVKSKWNPGILIWVLLIAFK